MHWVFQPEPITTSQNSVWSIICQLSLAISVASISAPWDPTKIAKPFGTILRACPAPHIIRLPRSPIQITCQQRSKMRWWYKVHHVEIGMFSVMIWCQIAKVSKIAGQHIMMPYPSYFFLFFYPKQICMRWKCTDSTQTIWWFCHSKIYFLYLPIYWHS